LLSAEARTPAELEAMVERRVAGLPLEYVLGWAEFCGTRFAVAEGVFVPRPRTEFLVDQAARRASGAERPVVVDLCCGSGAVGVAVVAGLVSYELYSADVDPDAVSCARENLGARGEVFEGDLYEPLPRSLRGRVDVLVANVPYVPTAEIELMPREARIYEARIALDGGVDGLDVVRRLAASAASWLAPGGGLLVEASRPQARRVSELFAQNGLEPEIAHSVEFDATVVAGTRAFNRR
jgi:release factor glutamine methyltransferase